MQQYDPSGVLVDLESRKLLLALWLVQETFRAISVHRWFQDVLIIDNCFFLFFKIQFPCFNESDLKSVLRFTVPLHTSKKTRQKNTQIIAYYANGTQTSAQVDVLYQSYCQTEISWHLLWNLSSPSCLNTFKMNPAPPTHTFSLHSLLRFIFKYYLICVTHLGVQYCWKAILEDVPSSSLQVISETSKVHSLSLLTSLTE